MIKNFVMILIFYVIYMIMIKKNIKKSYSKNII